VVDVTIVPFAHLGSSKKRMKDQPRMELAQ
jgi:hypothetical protein